MADTNPANFANLPKEQVQEIASMGGKASHGSNGEESRKDSMTEGRNSDGTFVKGSEAAKEAGHLGGLHAAGKDEKENEANGCREDGTFKPGSEAAKEAGHLGGLHAQGKLDDNESGRCEDGTFKPGSDAAQEAGHKGGLAAAASSN